MKFPKLLAAMAAKGKRHYEVARSAGMTETRFSRCLRGLQDFSFEEREKIGQFLGHSARSLFKEVTPAHIGMGKEKTIPAAEDSEVQHQQRAYDRG